jgi:hypothetical protein
MRTSVLSQAQCPALGVNTALQVMASHNKSLSERKFHLQKGLEKSSCNQNRLHKLNKLHIFTDMENVNLKH